MLARFSPNVRLLVLEFAILRGNRVSIESFVCSTAALDNPTSLMKRLTSKERSLGVSSTQIRSRWGEHSVYAVAELALVSDPPIDCIVRLLMDLNQQGSMDLH
ncbi:unnamed protein product [Clonostachys rosea]|uniref:Uncharacterized protein n=1 Tax=Bionectria ochroleuca TaxID=29856 RepID=A0ABY6U2V6_BIOOC|nr:unnamed protein product [Clonostachys rosea]